MGRIIAILSKCYLWRCYLLTFIIVGGVVEFDFSRLLKLTDQLCEEGILNSNTTKAQIGHCSYVPQNYESYRFVNGEHFHNDIKKADLIITHGGVGTLVYALKAKKKVIVFPRLGKYKEHLDDHQIDICSIYQKKGYCLMATTKDELKDCIQNIENFNPKQFICDNSKMSKILTDYIDSI